IFSVDAVAGQSRPAISEDASTESTMRSIRSLAKQVNKKAKKMAYEFHRPKQFGGRPANVVGRMVIQPIPAPDGIISAGTLPPNKSALRYMAKDIDANIVRIDQLRQSLRPVEPREHTWIAWQKEISNLRRNSQELNELLSMKDPAFFDVGTRV